MKKNHYLYILGNIDFGPSNANTHGGGHTDTFASIIGMTSVPQLFALHWFLIPLEVTLKRFSQVLYQQWKPGRNSNKSPAQWT